jgi:hypothetical protein
LIVEDNEQSKDKFLNQCWGSSYLKILLNYFQLVSILRKIDLKWDDNLLRFFMVQQIFSGSGMQVISIECLIQGNKWVIF